MVPVGGKGDAKEQSQANDQYPAQQVVEKPPPAEQATDQSSKSKGKNYFRRSLHLC